MSPSDPPQDPQLHAGSIQDDAGRRVAVWPAGVLHALGHPESITGAGSEAAHEAGSGNTAWTSVGGSGVTAGPPAGMETLDRLSQRLTMAGLRLASLRRRLAGVEDRMMLIQASDDLDEAIAEVRRLALSARGSQRP
jgi:hypothetical protein